MAAADSPLPLILVVEDNGDDFSLIVRALRRMDCSLEIEVLVNGAQAVERLCDPNSEQRLPDLVVLDWKIPLLMGGEVLKAVRDCARSAGVVVVAFSSSDSACDRDECRRLGGNGFVTKPIDYDEFLTAVYGIVASFAPQLCPDWTPTASQFSRPSDVFKLRAA